MLCWKGPTVCTFVGLAPQGSALQDGGAPDSTASTTALQQYFYRAKYRIRVEAHRFHEDILFYFLSSFETC